MTTAAPRDPKPLAGITVVSLEQALAAPLCTARLAACGARVIKVERPEGDFARGYDSVVHGTASYVVWTNAGKESVVLDLKQDEDVTLAHRMLAEADVFVQNLAPGATQRLGLDSSSLRQRHPRLITCDITGYGDGPYRDMKAYDFLIQCESGLVSVSGAPEAPGRFGVSICDIGTGMNAALAVMTALVARERTGRGSGVTVSLFDTAADWMSVPLAHLEHGGQAPQPVGLQHPSMCPYGAYATKEGQLVVIAVQNEREWRSLCTTVLGKPLMADDPRFTTNNARVEHRADVDAVIAERLSRMSTADLRRALGAAGIAYGSVNSVEQLSTHPQLRRWPMDVNGHAVQAVAPAIQAPWDDGHFPAVPALGEHTADVRAEFT